MLTLSVREHPWEAGNPLFSLWSRPYHPLLGSEWAGKWPSPLGDWLFRSHPASGSHPGSGKPGTLFRICTIKSPQGFLGRTGSDARQ